MGVGLLTLALAELGTRWVRPRPPQQVIDVHSPRLRVDEQGEIPVWSLRGQPYPRTWGDCAAEGGSRLAFAGDSVFTVVVGGARGDFPFPHRLAERWVAEGAGRCAIDLSVPGFGPEQQLAVLQREHERRPLSGVVVGVFKTTGAWTRAGRYWMRVDGMARTSTGRPGPGLWLPDRAHVWLLAHSALWRQFSLVRASRGAADRADEGERQRGYEALRVWASSEGVSRIWTLWPPLDDAFAAHGAGRSPRQAWMDRLGQRWRDQGEAVIWVAELMGDVLVEEVRGDPCCHYNAHGHRELADRLGPVLDRWHHAW